METVVIYAPGKINWTLDILSVDENDYHILDMLMHRITLCDKVTIKKAKSGITLTASQKWLPVDEKNTAYKSAKLFFEATGIDGGCEIHVKKTIPSGAGLAGGSADAAAVFKGLNHLYGHPLSDDQLCTLALKVGADVPFMLKSGLYRAGGIGEKLEKIPSAPVIPILLVMNTRQGASTKRVYGIYDEIGASKRPDTAGFIKALLNKDTEKMKECGGNVLTESAVTIAPDVQSIIDRLYAAGARFASMTGSGSAVFGVFDTIEEATEKRKLFSDLWNCACCSSNYGTRIKETY